MDAARDEVVGLHEFMVRWFTGSVGDGDRAFSRFVDVLEPQFSMIAPSGEVLDRDAVVASVRGAHGTGDASFAIEIREVVERLASVGAVVISYEEWQYVGDRVDSCRVSTAVFVPSPGDLGGVRWRHLHETLRSV